MRSLTTCLLTLSVLALTPLLYGPNIGGKVSASREEPGLPCYVVITKGVSSDNERTDLRVLMDAADINEANLAKLQRRFTDLYPDVEHLTVYINTSLTFLLGNYTTVEDVERRAAGIPPRPKVWEKDARAILIRNGEREEFGYKLQGDSPEGLKYVLVKGEDPYCGSCKRLERDLIEPTNDRALDHRETKEDLPCYFIIGNSVMNNRRFVRVFINSEDGDESKLRGLLRYFSQQYPEPDALVIKAYTNLEQESDFLVPSGNKYFIAGMFRTAGNEVIRYQRPYEKVITTIIRGADIFPSLDNYLETEGRSN
jgi:hypothetical protein